MKLYRVRLKGMQTSTTGTVYGDAFVVADNPDQAYKYVKKHLDIWDVGFIKDKRLDCVTLLADEGQDGESDRVLYIVPD